MRRILFLLIVIIGFLSCDNEIDLVADYADIPVVYGLITIGDTAQYIRLEKAFVDPETSALILAQNPDSIYYANASVSIIRESDGSVYPLNRVDGNLDGYPREEGAFASSPNYLYKINSNDIPLIAEEEYTLNVQTGVSENVVTSTIELLEAPSVTTPGASATVIDFDYTQPTRIRWTDKPSNYIFDLSFKMTWKERNEAIGGDFVDNSYTWVVTKSIDGTPAGESGNLLEYKVDGQEFYNVMAVNLESNPNIKRRNLTVDVILTAGGEEIDNYIRAGQSNLGITSSQDIPVYTNISNGRGVFSSVTRATTPDLAPSAGTLDSLINGSVTKSLNFEF